MERAGPGDDYAKIHIMSRSLLIREDEVEEIFRFRYRSVAAQTSKQGGHGRGLAIARLKAREYGGDVVLHIKGGYNIFTVLLPRRLFRPAPTGKMEDATLCV
jgi:signal transduction histidine kinase